jgi:3-oxoacid CoA-transferase subunit A
VADGGLPLRYDGSGGIAVASEPREVREFDGAPYVLARAIRTDFALVHARYGDAHGDLVYEKSAQNFHPAVRRGRPYHRRRGSRSCPRRASSSRWTCTPGIFVQRVAHVAEIEKRIERRTVIT